MNDHKRTRLEPEPTFTLQSTTLENEDSVKLLGIKIIQRCHFQRTSLKCMQESESKIECIKTTQLYT